MAPRFGIGEWYGYSFVYLTTEERKQYAAIAPVQNKQNAPPCPFQSTNKKTIPCTKKGGICSLRLYEQEDGGSAKPAGGDAGKLRVLCPHRFKQNDTVYSTVSEILIGTSNPAIVSEVRFLRRPANPVNPTDDQTTPKEDTKSEDVGNIDIVLVNTDSLELRWCALEIQAVYFSGEKMSDLFAHIANFEGAGIPFPDKVRRPDYRSSGPKRLMPQLQIKVPTLRRWGKKMAVVVDVPWFRTNLVGVETVDDISNCDIAWFLIDFDESTNPATLAVSRYELQTLERAVEGLTGGFPVTLAEFESKIRSKMSRAMF
ncbi:MAG: NotI family restriction endonuclease [Pyrinomonadaceae bacterium]